MESSATNEIEASGVDRQAIWSTFAHALDAELRPHTVIRGRSGLDHSVEAIAVDERKKRVIIVSAESSPRMAAMMQVDIQATMKDAKVLVARPVAIDLPEVVRRIAQPLGLSEIEIGKARRWINRFEEDKAANSELIESLGLDKSLTRAVAMFDTMPAMPQILSLVAQAGELPWSDIFQIFEESAETGSLNLTALMAKDSLGEDLRAGVCPIPLYELSEEDHDLFKSGRDREAARGRLKALGIYQYFFPSRDQLALGLIDEGLHVGAEIATIGETAPTLGHPFGESELVEKTSNFAETLSALKESGFAVEGEYGIEISEAGRTIRSNIKVRPQEGLLSKILNRISVNLSPFDVIK